MDDVFNDLFQGIIKDFDDFTDALKNAFKDLLAELANAAILRPITIRLQTILQGGEAGEGGQPGFGNKGGFGDFGSVGGIASSIGVLIGGAAIGQIGGSLTGASSGVAAIGGAIGAAVGSIFGPLGSLIGGFLGGAIGGFLFGGKETVTGQGVNLGITGGQVTGSQFTDIHRKGGLFRSSKRTTDISALDQQLVEGLQEAIDTAFGVVTAIAEALGTTGDAFDKFTLAAQRLDLQGLSEAEAAAKITEFLTNAIGAGIEFFIRNTEGLSDRLKNIVLSFSGNAEDLIAAFESAAAIELTLDIEPLEAAKEILFESQKTLNDVYKDQQIALGTLIEEYDGSLESLQALAEGFVIVRQTQTELMLFFLTLREGVAALFGNTAQTIREALLSEEELFDLRQTQVDSLVDQLNSATDPADIARIAEEINALTLQAFNLLDESQQQELGQGFLDFLDEVNTLAQERIDIGIAAVEEDANALDLEVAAKLSMVAAEIQLEAARINRDIADRWEDFLERRFGEMNLR